MSLYRAMGRNQQLLRLAPLLLSLSSICCCCLAQNNSLCFEPVSDIAALYLQEHPAGGMLAVAEQKGVIQLISLPAVGSGQQADVISTYLDISDRVLYDGSEQGLLSFAFHPGFLKNGRFFVSYICRASAHADCQAACAISIVKKDADCKYTTIVSEYSALPNPKSSTSLNSTEVRKILRFGRPYSNHNGGHIWFGPDGYLYYTSGDGGSQGDPHRTAQNLQIPLGKVLRLDVDSTLEEMALGWYTIPQDNPFYGNDSALWEVYALGLRNPWRCFIDSVSNVTLCGDVGADAMEEVDVLLKGHNYGWSFFEGTLDGPHRDPPDNPVGGNFTFPVLEYHHPEVDDGIAIIGGVVYRANRNPCLQGSYIYGDQYGLLFTGTVYENGSVVPLDIGQDQEASYSVMDLNEPTTSSKGTVVKFGLNELYSWGMDSALELYRLSSLGIHRVTNSTTCGFRCEGKLEVMSPPPQQVYSPPTPSAPPVLAPALAPAELTPSEGSPPSSLSSVSPLASIAPLPPPPQVMSPPSPLSEQSPSNSAATTSAPNSNTGNNMHSWRALNTLLVTALCWLQL